jgi:hypothetical protein
MSILYFVTVDVGYRASTRDASVRDGNRLVRLQAYIGVALGWSIEVFNSFVSIDAALNNKRVLTTTGRAHFALGPLAHIRIVASLRHAGHAFLSHDRAGPPPI